jgi:uncharacterized protein (TIGR03437 family)
LRKYVHVFAISLFLFSLRAQAQAPSFTANGVLNFASMTPGPLAPGMVAAIVGSNLGAPNFPGNCLTTSPTPATCTEVSVLINGAAAPKIYDSATEVTFQVPFNITGTTATVQVTSTVNGALQSSPTVTVPVATVAPGLFTASGAGSGTGDYVDTAGLVAVTSGAVQLGDTVVLFGTGFGATNPAVPTGSLGPTPGAVATATPITLTINSQSVPVTFAGLEPGNQSGAVVGYDEVVFTVPSTLTVPPGQTSATFPVVLTVGGVASQSVNLIVAAPPVSITSINPSPVPLSASPQTVTFTGAGFESGLVLKLESPGMVQSTVSGANINFLSATQFTAQITTGTTAGTWSALVSNPDGSTSSVFSFPASGTGPTNVPTISYIITTSSGSTNISQNAWIEVHGTNLSTGVSETWSNASFANGLPTNLGGTTATVDNLQAAIFYASPTQVNILAPLDSNTGLVPVVIATPNGSSTPTGVTEVQVAPALLVLDAAGHVAAEHATPPYPLLGPASLDQPGYPFTPGVRGETVIIYATGFGQTSPLFTNQIVNTGLNAGSPFPLNLPTPLPTVTIGNLPATVSFAGLVSPGLYQLNVTIPASAPSGDLPIVAMYNGSSSQSTAVITVQ